MPIVCPKCGSGRVHKIGVVKRQNKLDMGYECGRCKKEFQIEQDYKGKYPITGR